MSLIHQACCSDHEFTMKAILIGFAVQHPENIELMKAFVGNWEGSQAVIVRMPKPGKAYTLETAMKIDKKMDVQWVPCSKRSHLLQYIAVF